VDRFSARGYHHGMVGEVVGQYRLTRKIGEGGMGAVYVGEHMLLGRPAAIKVLLRDLSHRPDLVARFFNEARAATAVKHPGIVEIYDFGYHVDGSAYIVMELLEGESLASRLAALGRLSPERAVALCRQIAGALGAAHAKRIVHRDLKPDNIFIVIDPDIVDGERTKILDFGIAKLASEQSGISKTRTGTVLGTPAYMSPEQSKGAGNVDARADLYALGCILFEMLCGRPPFVAEGGGEVMAQHIYAAVPMPSSIAPVSQELEQLVVRALAKDPAHRFQSAHDIIAALQMAVPPNSKPLGAVRVFTAQERSPHASTPAQTTLSAANSTTSSLPTPRRRAWLVATVAILVITVGAGATAFRQRSSASLPAVPENASSPASQPATPEATSSSMNPTVHEPADGSPASAPIPPPPEPSRVAATPTPPTSNPDRVAPTPTAPHPEPSRAVSAPTAPTPTPDHAARTPPTPPPVRAAPPQTPSMPTKEPGIGSPPGAANIPTQTKRPTAAVEPPQTPAHASVTIRLTSEPRGADVVRMPDGTRIGTTPLTYDAAAMAGSLSLVVKKRGYTDQSVIVSTDRDTDKTITLIRSTTTKQREPKPSHPGAGAGSAAAPASTLDPFEKLTSKPEKP
jgi:serine/threonine protein kinase